MSVDKHLVDNYPAIRNATEVERLHLQHDLVVNALGSLLLCPFDLTAPNVRVLDIGSADGWWLTQLRKKLNHPESATLIGTDIAPYPNTTENVVMHNFKTPFPEEWKSSFDLVQLRAVLSNVPGDASTDLIKRVIELLKPGGFIQLVDGAMPSGQVEADAKPHMQFFVTLGNFLNNNGLNASQGAKAAQSLKDAGQGMLEDIGVKDGRMLLGKGAILEESSWQWLSFMQRQVGPKFVLSGLMSQDELDKLQLQMLEEAKQVGFDLPWYATWARKAA